MVVPGYSVVIGLIIVVIDWGADFICVLSYGIGVVSSFLFGSIVDRLFIFLSLLVLVFLQVWFKMHIEG